VGWPLPYSRTRVVKLDAEGRLLGDCAPNEIGVVAMAGPGVFGGYLSDVHNRGAFVEPGWVNSGDLGRLDERGQLWITGRAKDLIIRGAHNIDPAPLEELLYRHPAVALAALVGQPDAYAGELPVAYVQLKPGSVVSATELVGYLREHTPERAAVPVALHFVDPMPLTAVGKVFKPALRVDAMRRVAEQLLEGLIADGEPLVAQVVADARHGHVIRVSLRGAKGASREQLCAAVHDRLNPLTVRHEIV
jgi:fatty-acyl-CoA synthase